MKLALSAIIGKDVALVKRNGEHLGRCPFHKEKTPSFRVNDEKGVYYCFGCGERGNAQTYLAKKHGLSREAVLEFLGEKPTYGQISPLFDVYEQACLFFESHVSVAHDYLNVRAIGIEAAKEFRLGFCPDDTKLFNFLKERFAPALLERSKLFIRGNHPFFYKRLIFPIWNTQGKVIAFGGRGLHDGATPKYINSCETEIFSKQHVLYRAPYNKKTSDIIITEGYFDVIRLYEKGYSAVAPLGTSLSVTHLEDIWKKQRRVYVCFDGDRAGQNAVKRLMSLALPFVSPSNNLMFIDLPEGKDPDSLLKEDPTAFEPLKEQAKSLCQCLWQDIKERFHLTIPEEVAKAREYVDAIAKSIKNYHLAQEYKTYLLNTIRKEVSFYKYEKQVLPFIEKNRSLCEQLLLELIIRHPILLEEVQESLGRVKFENCAFEEVRGRIIKMYYSAQSLSDLSMPPISILDLDMIEEDKARLMWWDIWNRLFGNYQERLSIEKWQSLKERKQELVKGDILK